MIFLSYPRRLGFVIGLSIIGTLTINGVLANIYWRILYLTIPLCFVVSILIILKYMIIYKITNDSIIIKQIGKVYEVKFCDVLYIKETKTYGERNIREPVYTIVLKKRQIMKEYLLIFSNSENDTFIINSGFFKIIKDIHFD